MILSRELKEMICMDTTSSQVFSAQHPSDLLERIIADGASQSQHDGVYRISRSGVCNRDAFLCTALENSQTIPVNNRDAYLAQMQTTYDVDHWSTSCWNDFERTIELYSLMLKRIDSPKILKGNILPQTGYSIITTNRPSIKSLPMRKQRKRAHHIDWWIFESQDVSIYFEEVEV
jgi:hypothetical protein